MASPDTDYHAWLTETAELVEHGRWEDVAIEALGEELRGRARGRVRELHRALARWLEAGARRDHEAARREMAAIRALLTASPSLAAYEPLQRRVHAAWRDTARRLRREGARVPRLSHHDLDRAAGKIRRRLGGVSDAADRG